MYGKQNGSLNTMSVVWCFLENNSNQRQRKKMLLSSLLLKITFLLLTVLP